MLNYKIQGEKGIPLLLMHGLLGSLDNWQSHALWFSQYQLTISVDLRNHGRSFHSEKMTLNNMVEDVYEVLHYLGYETCYLLGHSLGGKVAMTAAKLGLPIEKLIVADIGIRKYNSTHESIFKALQHVDISILKKRSDADEALKPLISDNAIRTFILKSLYLNAETQRYQWRFNVEAIVQNYESMVDNIDFKNKVEVPTLFVKGEQSNYITVQDEEHIKQSFTNATIKTINKAGHWLHADQPDIFRNKVQEFLF